MGMAANSPRSMVEAATNNDVADDDASDSSSISSRENDVFAIKESLIPPQERKLAGTKEISFDGLLDTPLILKEDLKEGCGGQLWPAGMILSKYMLRYHRNDLVGKSILELGAGGGLVGLAVARGCNLGSDNPNFASLPPQTLYITDQVPMYALMKENIILNDLSSKVEAAIYDWGTPMPDHIVFKGKTGGKKVRPDIILAADCVYFEPSFPLLKETLIDLLLTPVDSEGQDVNKEPRKCYFAFKKRRKADWRFMRMIGKLFQIQEINVDDNGVVLHRNDTLEHDADRGPGLANKEGVYLYCITPKR